MNTPNLNGTFKKEYPQFYETVKTCWEILEDFSGKLKKDLEKNAHLELWQRREKELDLFLEASIKLLEATRGDLSVIKSLLAYFGHIEAEERSRTNPSRFFFRNRDEVKIERGCQLILEIALILADSPELTLELDNPPSSRNSNILSALKEIKIQADPDFSTNWEFGDK